MSEASQLATEILALINSKPRTPFASEIDAVILKYAETVGIDAKVEEIAPVKFMEVLGDKLLEGVRAAEFSDHDVRIWHAAPFVLIIPNDMSRHANGLLIKPRRMYARWYCEEYDQIKMELIKDWAVVRIIAPRHYNALMRAMNT